MFVVLFRVEGGPAIGWGHLTRCQAMAEAFQELGDRAVFLTRPDAATWFSKRGFETQTLPDDCGSGEEAVLVRYYADVLSSRAMVIDLPAKLERWETTRSKVLQSLGKPEQLRIVLEDQARGEIPGADVVVNSNSDVPDTIEQVSGQLRLGGLRYQSIRSDFSRQRHVGIRSPVQKVLFCLGGSDSGGFPDEIGKALDPVLPKECKVFLAGAKTGDLDPQRFSVLDNPDELPRAASGCDLAIVGGGQIKYEMASLGVPSVVIPLATDQARSCRAWADSGGMVVTRKKIDDLPGLVARLVQDPEERQKLARWGRKMVDGQGARRIAELVHAMLEDRSREPEGEMHEC